MNWPLPYHLKFPTITRAHVVTIQHAAFPTFPDLLHTPSASQVRRRSPTPEYRITQSIYFRVGRTPSGAGGGEGVLVLRAPTVLGNLGVPSVFILKSQNSKFLIPFTRELWIKCKKIRNSAPHTPVSCGHHRTTEDTESSERPAYNSMQWIGIAKSFESLRLRVGNNNYFLCPL